LALISGSPAEHPDVPAKPAAIKSKCLRVI